MPTRKATASWKGPFREGSGSFHGESGAINATYSIGSRFAADGGSNPEELLAAALASCFSMALSGNLERNGTPASRVDTDVACTIDKDGDGFSITRMDVVTRVIAEGIDEAKFQEIATATKSGCPVSKVMANNVEMNLDASLVSSLPDGGSSDENMTASNNRGGGTFPNIRV